LWPLYAYVKEISYPIPTKKAAAAFLKFFCVNIVSCFFLIIIFSQKFVCETSAADEPRLYSVPEKDVNFHQNFGLPPQTLQS
jgi:hypothetical protein